MAVTGRALLTLVATVLPVAALAQPRLRGTAVLEFSEHYDDNLFPNPTTPVRQGDFIYRIGPRLGLAYAGRRTSLNARYARDAEAYAWNPELDTHHARQEAAFDAAWSPGPILRMEAGALYEDTTMARELNLVTGLDTPRLPARRGSTLAAVTVGLGRATRIRAEHTFTSEKAAGFPTVETQVASVLLQRRMRDSESATLTLSERRYAASGGATRSHVLALGWSRQVTPRARVDIKGGPRFSNDGTIGPEGPTGSGFIEDVFLEYFASQGLVPIPRDHRYCARNCAHCRFPHRGQLVCGGPEVCVADNRVTAIEGLGLMSGQLHRH